MQLTWLTDIHLNFIHKEDRYRFYREILKTSSDGILISGDIAEAPSVANMLKEMADEVKKPIFFVLGNHDYYHGQVEDVKAEMMHLTQQQELLYWLPTAGPQDLSNNAILLGEDGWADGRYGDYANSSVVLNDCRLISDLSHSSHLGKYKLLETMQALADNDAEKLQQSLNNIILKKKPKKIIILTHVPPFDDICLYEGKKSTDDFLPFFASKVMGNVLTQVALDNSAIDFLVLCGHTHAKAYCQRHGNLTVKVGMAEYKEPQIQGMVTV